MAPALEIAWHLLRLDLQEVRTGGFHVADGLARLGFVFHAHHGFGYAGLEEDRAWARLGLIPIAPNLLGEIFEARP